MDMPSLNMKMQRMLKQLTEKWMALNLIDFLLLYPSKRIEKEALAEADQHHLIFALIVENKDIGQMNAEKMTGGKVQENADIVENLAIQKGIADLDLLVVPPHGHTQSAHQKAEAKKGNKKGGFAILNILHLLVHHPVHIRKNIKAMDIENALPEVDQRQNEIKIIQIK
eukprot:TRINITY_DN2003_c0_g1_i4.p2 TRINITY_DN2003_c0_g1~~TRINITY_DN2003_c0_g1_i4.p2  ORF type:complete len:169 (+),score=25.69 TRINITY_DN2003_c0_g1_i4:331-837(+)